MNFAFFLQPEPNELWTVAAQLGVENAVTGLPHTSDGRSSWDFLPMLQMKNHFNDRGLNVAVIESS